MTDVEFVARKLRPLMPAQVDRWMRARQTADAELRELIDRQILATAQRKLGGDVRKRVLLSLPPPRLIRGALNLGTVLYEKEKWPAGLRHSELLQGLSIFGRSGAGKTNLMLHLLLQLEKQGVPWLFLDWKRTARHLLPRFRRNRVNLYTPGRELSPMAFNPFLPPPGLEDRVYIGQVVDVLASAYTLGDGSRRILQKAITGLFAQHRRAPTLGEIIEAVEAVPGQERVRGWKVSALRALESLSFAQAVSFDLAEQGRFARRLLCRNTIVELDGLAHNAAAFVIPLLLLWIFYTKLADPQRERLRLVVIVEEAHHVLYSGNRRSRESLMNTLIRSSRELGIGYVVIDQLPHLISSAALGNSFATVFLNLKEASDVRLAAAMSSVDDAYKRCFGRLPVGQAVVKLQDRWREPFLVRIPHVRHAKGGMTDARLRQWLSEGRRTRSAGQAAPAALWPQVPRVRLWDEALDERELQFLHDVMLRPDDGVKARYRRLNFSGSIGHAVKERLLAEGWLEGQLTPLGRTRKLLLRLSIDARKSLRIPTDALHSRASVAHEYWKQYHAHRLAQRGWRVTVEAPRVGGRVDLLAARQGRRIGIEVETGQSDVIANVRNCLRSKMDRVVVVATDANALTRVERQLASARLLGTHRVTLARADQQGDGSSP